MTKPMPEGLMWIVNDQGELGVKIGKRLFFIYKGEPLEYTAEPIRYRQIGKREFGESGPISPDFDRAWPEEFLQTTGAGAEWSPEVCNPHCDIAPPGETGDVHVPGCPNAASQFQADDE